MSTPALKVRELSICLTHRPERQLVDEISFSIRPGKATGLVGESGCGKTMTALAIMGLLPPGLAVKCAGIELAGRDISNLDPRQKRRMLGRDVAMIFQQPATALDPVFTLGQQISTVYQRHNQTNRAQTRRTVLESLEQVGFRQPGEIANAYPHQLSGGMRQLAMIAMATICKPAVIIADEPTTALDASVRSLILDQLARLRQQHNMALLLISHDLTVVRQCCDDVLVMYCGRLLEQASSHELFSHPRHPYSAGLLSCIPTLDEQPAPVIQTIPGQVPTPGKLPPGCHFAPRCFRVTPECRLSAPDLELKGGHATACFQPLS